MDIALLLILFSIGLIAGLFAGLIGIGGGLFYVLIYSYILSQNEIATEEEYVRLIITNSIISTFFAALSSTIKQMRSNNFYFMPVLWIGMFGVLASIVLTAVISYIPFYNRKVFAVVFTMTIIPLLGRMLIRTQNEARQLIHVKKWQYVLIGLFSGSGTALSGLGGAFIITPILNGWLRVDIKEVVSISSAVIVLVAGGTSIYNVLFNRFETNLPHLYGGIYLPMILPVIIGVSLSAPFGVRLSKQISPKLIRIIFICFCLAVIFRNILILFND